MTDCAVANCTRPAQARDPLCAMHRKRLQRGQEQGAPEQEKLEPFERALQAGIELADCDSGDDAAYERAVDRFRKASLGWVLQLLKRGEVSVELVAAAVVIARRRAGIARWAGMDARDRSAAMRLLALQRWGEGLRDENARMLASGRKTASEGVRGRGQDGGHGGSRRQGAVRQGPDARPAGERLPEGGQRQPGRLPARGEGDSSPGPELRAGGPRPAGAADAAGQGSRSRRAGSRGGDGPRGPAAVRARAGQAGRDDP